MQTYINGTIIVGNGEIIEVGTILVEEGKIKEVGQNVTIPENADKGWHTLLALEEAGVPFAITTDHPVVGSEYLMTSVAQAVKHGLSEASAWKSVTISSALHIGIEDRLGPLEKGKDADLVIWSSHPFDVTANVEKTIIEGELVFEA